MILMELNGSTVEKAYICANGQIIAQHDGVPATNNKYFYLHDRLGSVRQIINYADSQVNVKNRYTYKPFGELFDQPGEDETEETVTNSFKFTGQYYDSEISQYYLRARQYDPYLARFTARDPVAGRFEEPLSLHSYLYCQNEPINRFDVLGLYYALSGAGLFYDEQETQTVLDLATQIVGAHRIWGPYIAFVEGGPWGPSGMFAYKGSDFEFQVGGAHMIDSEFSNYLAGYTCEYNYGAYGNLGVRAAGHGDALYELGHFDERESRYFVSAGILKGMADRAHEGRPVGPLAYDLAKYEQFYAYDWMIDALADDLAGSPQFDMLLTNWTELWNAGTIVRW